MVRKSLSRRLCVSLFTLLMLGAFGCEEEVPEDVESADPILGLMEFPISHRINPAPSGSVEIEVSPDRVRVAQHTVLELDGHGHLPDGARTGDVITALQTALRTGPASRTATLSLHANTPYLTMSLILSTLVDAHISEVAFAVRTVGEPSPGFIVINDFEVRPEAQEMVEFPATHMPAWGDVATHWEAMYTACRDDHYVDCAFKPGNIAEGGQTHITLFIRGNAVKVELHRIGEPVPEANTGAVDMIDGVAPPVAQLEEELPPATHAAFTWRYNATTDAESQVSATMRPLCGARSCAALVTAEGQTAAMRVLSFIGAAFPTGTEAPKLMFQIPPR